MSRRTVLAAISAGCLLACSSDPILVTPRSFDRAGRAAFGCMDRVTSAPLAEDRCARTADGTLPADVTPFALVLQTSRGEVATIDLRENELLDSDPIVPGYTFVPVGELPTDIVIPASARTITVVANYGTRDLWVVKTEAFLGVPTADATPLQRVRLMSGPTALAVSNDGTRIFAALPDAGAIAVVNVVSDRVSDPTYVSVGTAVPAGSAPSVPATYERFCPSDTVIEPSATVTPRTPVALGATPRPSSFAVDEAAGRLYVADAALPIIHVFDTAAELTALPSLAPGVPVRALALTPDVPDAIGGSCPGAACRKYIYAIDAVDGSVLGLDLSDGSVVTAASDRVARPDRISFSSTARALAVLTPDADGPSCTADSLLGDDASPTKLRGVFLAVALADGTVRVVDVHDLDAECRRGAACDAPANGSDTYTFLRRHRARVGEFVDESVALLATPSFTSSSGTLPVGADGATDSSDVPDLLALPSCPAGMARVFPDDPASPPLLCGLADPWAPGDERYSVSLDGIVPGTAGGRGAFVAGSADAFVGEVDFCARGVLGSADTAAVDEAEPERAYGGDVLAITAELPPGADPGCEALLPKDEAGEPEPVTFAIREARSASLALDAESVSAPGVFLDDMRACFGELMTFEVRARDAYIVTSSRNGALHRVRADDRGRCIVDTTLDARRQLRALPGTPYQSPFVAFTIQDPRDLEPPAFPDPNVELTFAIGNVPAKLATDAGTLPSALHYNPTDERLYSIDAASRGLVQIDLQPFAAARSFE